MRTPGQRLAYQRARRARRHLEGWTAQLSLSVLAVLGFALLVLSVPLLAAVAAVGVCRPRPARGLSVRDHAATFQTSRIYDRNGTLLYEFVDPRAGMRTVVPLAQVPESLRDATIAIEDKNFYTNPGFDLTGIARAAYVDLVRHRIVAGGSTITQQLVKTIYLSPQVSFQRKLEELVLGYRLTREKTKIRS